MAWHASGRWVWAHFIRTLYRINTNTCVVYFGIVAIESFCFQSRKSCFCTNTHAAGNCTMCILCTCTQPHWRWCASVWVNGARLIHFAHNFSSIAGHSDRDKQQMCGEQERAVVVCVRAHCNSSFHFRIYPSSFTQCLETKRFTTATVISQYTHAPHAWLIYHLVSGLMMRGLFQCEAEKQNKNRNARTHVAPRWINGSLTLVQIAFYVWKQKEKLYVKFGLGKDEERDRERARNTARKCRKFAFITFSPLDA